jgi:hypothetical protein
MEAMHSSGTSVLASATRRHIPEDGSPHPRRCPQLVLLVSVSCLLAYWRVEQFLFAKSCVEGIVTSFDTVKPSAGRISSEASSFHWCAVLLIVYMPSRRNTYICWPMRHTLDSSFSFLERKDCTDISHHHDKYGSVILLRWLFDFTNDTNGMPLDAIPTSGNNIVAGVTTCGVTAKLATLNIVASWYRVRE